MPSENSTADNGTLSHIYKRISLYTASSQFPGSRITKVKSRRKCLQLVVYFTIFYSLVLFFFFAYMHLLMYFHIDRERPKLTGLQSALEFNPGLSMIPRPNLRTSLLRGVASDILVCEGYFSEFMAFLSIYERYASRVEMTKCGMDDGTYEFNIERPCAFDLNSAWPCSLTNGYGWDSSSPCILLKMNNIYGWVPDPVEGASGVVVKCEGATQDDTLNLGDIRYYDLSHHYTAESWGAKIEGKQGNGTFHSDFFPYLNQRWYLQPIVWVTFTEMQRDRLTRVKCWLIAKNIHVDFQRGEGSVKFEILIN